MLTSQNEQVLLTIYAYCSSNETQSKYVAAINTCLTDQISWPFLTFSSVTEKTGHCQGSFGSWEHALVAVIV